MSRIAALFRPRETAPQRDRRLLDAALRTLPGTRIAVQSRNGASLGRIAFEPAGIKGGIGAHAGWLVALDGAIINAADLAEDAQDQSDHAALLGSLLASLGPQAALEKIEGDFAAAAYDAANDRLWLLRDRLGVKPLYWAAMHGGFACASQPRALLGLPGISSEPDRGFVGRFAGMHYRTFDNAPEHSPYRDISQVPAGGCVELSAQGASERRYWELEPQSDIAGSEDELADQYRTLLLEAVRKRLGVAGRPIFTLSGGLDSSSVLCCAVAAEGGRADAISSVYRDETFDERHEIRDVVDERPVDWHPIEVPDDIDLFAEVARMVWLHDEPVATATWLSHNLVARHAATHGFDSIFGGLGGDELNAGEYEYFPCFFADLAAEAKEEQLERELSEWSRHHDHPIHRKSPAIGRAMMDRVTDSTQPGRCVPDEARLGRYLDAVDREYVDVTGFRPQMPAPFSSYLKNRTFQDMFYETLPCCLRAEDRQCTALGLTHFDPFLDHHVIEFMFRVPGSLKIRDGVTKQLLRLAMRGVLPEATRTRVKKVGWNAPAHIWFSGRNLEALRDLTASRRFRERGIYKTTVVERLIDEHVETVESAAARDNHMMFLWQLVNLELWLESIAVPQVEVAQ